MAQLSTDGAKYATLGMGTLNVIMTLVSLFLVEVFGRKTLLLVGFSAMFIDTVLLTIALMFAVSICAVVFLMLRLSCSLYGAKSAFSKRQWSNAANSFL